LPIRTSLSCRRRWTTRWSQRTCLWPLGRKLQYVLNNVRDGHESAPSQPALRLAIVHAAVDVGLRGRREPRVEPNVLALETPCAFQRHPSSRTWMQPQLRRK
jgi:hypothetical protein